MIRALNGRFHTLKGTLIRIKRGYLLLSMGFPVLEVTGVGTGHKYLLITYPRSLRLRGRLARQTWIEVSRHGP